MEFFDLDNYPKKAVQERLTDLNVITLTGTSGTANITAGGLTKLCTWVASTLTLTAAKFVADWSSAYQAIGVVVTANAGVLSFTSQNKEISASIVPATSNLAGVATAVFVPDFSHHRIFRLALGAGLTISNPINAIDGAYARFETKPDMNRVTLTGSSGTANVTAGGITRLATWGTGLTETATAFVASWAADYLLAGLVLTSSTATLIFTPVGNVLVNASIVPVTTNLDGTVTSNYTSTWGDKYDIAGGSITTQTVNGRDIVDGYYNITEDRFQIVNQAQALS